MEASEHVQTLSQFLIKELPEKETLVDGLAYTNDIISLTGRRREGKTTLACNLGLALAARPTFLGYEVPKPRRVLMLLLEDDTRELQDKFKRMSFGLDTGDRLAIHTRDDFFADGISIDIANDRFKKRVAELYSEFRPDLVILDNLGHFISADYNNSPKMHQFLMLIFDLRRQFSAAHLILAHPRKRDKKGLTAKLHESPEEFFEECMGTSHFINTTSSLWGIERNRKTGKTYFVGGNQRLNGTEGTAMLELDDCGWFQLVSDYELNLCIAVNTETRQKAWGLFPNSPFNWTEARESARSVMSSNGSFNPWWRELKRLRLVLELPDGSFVKASPKSGKQAT
jgi:hypothetical protein